MVDRQNWIAPVVDADFGNDEDEPRWFYKVGDKEREWDARVRSITPIFHERPLRLIIMRAGSLELEKQSC